MKDTEHSKPTVKFKYIFSKDYNPVFANGAWGGICPSGEITINFYFERAGLPISATNVVKDNGTLGQEIEIIPSDQQASLVRYIENGVIMTLNGAKIFHKWLGDKIKEAEQVQLIIEKQNKGLSK